LRLFRSRQRRPRRGGFRRGPVPFRRQYCHGRGGVFLGAFKQRDVDPRPVECLGVGGSLQFQPLAFALRGVQILPSAVQLRLRLRQCGVCGVRFVLSQRQRGLRGLRLVLSPLQGRAALRNLLVWR